MAHRSSELAELQLQPFVDFFDRQVSIKGPAVLLKPEAAQALGLALHELANNAKKFGALSVPEGQVSVTWSFLRPWTATASCSNGSRAAGPQWRRRSHGDSAA